MADIERGTVPIAVASKVLKIDCQTLRLLLQNKMVDFGIAYKRPGSKQYSYIIYAEPFYRLTGYRHKESEGRDVFLADSSYVLSMAEQDFKHIKFHFTSEF